VAHELTICTEVDPQLLPAGEDHEVRCWLYHDHPQTGFTAPLGAQRSDVEGEARWAPGAATREEGTA
jgi:hypothetical protein